MTYVPELNGKCYEVLDRHTLRVYTDTPSYNKNIPYYDVYLDSHYQMTGTNYAWFWYNTENSKANLPACLNNNTITNEVYYRNDFDSIMIIFICLCLVIFYLPTKILFRLFRRFN